MNPYPTVYWGTNLRGKFLRKISVDKSSGVQYAIQL